MTADPTNSRAAFEAKLEQYVDARITAYECLQAERAVAAADAVLSGLLALYDQAAQSAAAVAPDAAVYSVVEQGYGSHHFIAVTAPADWSIGTRVRITRLPEPTNG